MHICILHGTITSYTIATIYIRIATPSEVHVKHSSYKAFNPAFDSFLRLLQILWESFPSMFPASVLPFPYQICDQAQPKSTVKVISDNINNSSTIYV